ncbi:hypothetical protein BC833DRAFT_567194 [Globomyces pollinis-pini]|nr:hypothetical protein BC833DRAFT_567194 [Globomyces pollinis-pini]
MKVAERVVEEENPEVSWKTTFTHKTISPQTKLSIHYPRLIFYHILFSIPFLISVCLLFLQDIYHVISYHSIQTLNSAFDYNFGTFFFSYRLVESPENLKSIESIYSTDWTTQSYFTYCRQINFQTRFSDGPLIDLDFFCNSYNWTTVQMFQTGAVICGILYTIILLDNIRVWNGYSILFKKLDMGHKAYDRLRRVFKVFIWLCVAGHLFLQISSILLIFRIKYYQLIQTPQHLLYSYGVFFAFVSMFFDVIFLCLFPFFDKLIFFHYPYQEKKTTSTQQSTTEASQKSN